MKLNKDNLEKYAPKSIKDPLFGFMVFVNGKFTQSDILGERGVLTNGIDYISIPAYLRSFPDAEFFPASEIKMPNNNESIFRGIIEILESPKINDYYLSPIDGKYREFINGSWVVRGNPKEDLDRSIAEMEEQIESNMQFDSKEKWVDNNMDVNSVLEAQVESKLEKWKVKVIYDVLKEDINKIDSFLKTKFGEDYDKKSDIDVVSPVKPERILCAAIKQIFNTGERITAGVNYDTIEMKIFDKSDVTIYGFLTTHNRFVNPTEAYQIHFQEQGRLPLRNLTPEDLL